MSLFKTAAAKDKVAKYKITDPYVIFFINTYEKLIDWNRVKEAKDITDQINTVLLPQLKSKIDPYSADNNYLKDYNVEKEVAAHPNDPEVQRAYKIYQQDPVGAKKRLIDPINKSKEESFFVWWNYFNEKPLYYEDSTRDIYRNNPAFTYCILNKILNSSGPSDKNEVIPLNLLVVSDLYKMVADKGGQSFNILKHYDEMYGKRMEEGAVDDGFGNKWLRIPSKIHDPVNYQVNRDKLVGLSLPNGWCTGTTMTDRYLSMGDFWLLLKNGKAVTAIRLEGENTAKEIRGYHNGVPEAYWEPIFRLIRKEKFDVSNCIYYRQLKDIEEANIMFSKENPEARKEYVDAIRNGDTDKYNRLKQEYKEFPDIRAAAVECWVGIVGPDPTRFSQCPEELKNEPAIQNAAKNYWLAKVQKDPNEYDNMPNELKNMPEFREGYKTYWVSYVRRRPYKYSFSPVEFRDSPEMLEAVKTGWMEGVAQGKFDPDGIPDEYKQMEGFSKARLRKWVNLLQTNPYAYEDCPEEYKNLPVILNAGDMGWARELVGDPSKGLIGNPFKYKDCTMPFKNRPMVLKARLFGWIRKVKANPGYIRLVPPDVKSSSEFKEAIGAVGIKEEPMVEQEVGQKEAPKTKIPSKKSPKKIEASRLNSSFFNNNYIGKLGI